MGSKMTVDGGCNHEIERHLLFERKVMTTLDSLLKSRDIALPKGRSSQTSVFYSGHVWIWKFDHKESWAPKNWSFELWWWRRLLRVPWTARRSSPSILKGISSEYSLEGLMLKLKCQYLGHLIQRKDSLEKLLILGKIEGGRRRGWQRMSLLVDITKQFLGVGDVRGSLGCFRP